MSQALPLLFLLILSGVFSGTEIALFSLKKEQILTAKQKAVSKRKKAAISKLEEIQNDPQKTLVTILLCNNVVNILASSMATVLALGLGETLNMGLSQSTMLAIVTGVMTFLILLFGEITPKALAHRYALGFGIKIAPIIWWLSKVLSPLIVPMSWMTKKLVGHEESLSGLTQEEIKAAVSLSQTEGSIDAEEREMVESVLELDEVKVEEVMTPRSKIFGLDENEEIKQALEKINEAAFSRIPTFITSLDDMSGVITKQTILEYIAKNGLSGKIKEIEKLEPKKVPTTMPIAELLRHFRKEKTLHQAHVYDEHGGLVGLISLEDILEEIVGEIHDETDEEIIYVKRDGELEYLLHGEGELEVIEQKLKADHGDWTENNLPWSREEEHKTLKAYIIEKLEHFPEKGETLSLETAEYLWNFVIKAKNGEQIGLVGLTLVKKEI